MPDKFAEAIKNTIRTLSALRDESGKFTKSQAYYVNDAAQKPFRCGNCEHFEADEGKCNLVSEQGPPNPGVISSEGACSLYNARPARITALQWMWGRAEQEGLAPEVVRANAFMFTYAALDEEPPTELAEKAVIDPEDVRPGNLFTSDEY